MHGNDETASGRPGTAAKQGSPPDREDARPALRYRGAYATRSPETWCLAGLLVFTILVRGGVLWAMRGNLQQDPDAYREIAENLLQHGEFALGKGEPDGGPTSYRPTAYRPPLYPVVLSNLPVPGGLHVSLFKVALLHVVLGAATVWLTWLTAMRYMTSRAGPEGRQEIAPTVRSGIDLAKESSPRSEGPAPRGAKPIAGPPGLPDDAIEAPSTPTSRSGLLPIGPPGLGIVPLIAGLLVACDPLLLNQQSLVMTETLAAFLAVLSLWCLARFDAQRSWFNAGLAGGAIGLAVLSRPTFLPWLGLVGVGMLFVLGRNSEFRIQNSEWRWLDDFGWRVANVAALAVAAAAVLSPWVIRNQRVFGKPIVTTTHGGYTLYLGNNRSFYAYLAKGDFSIPWDAATLDRFVFAKDVPLTEKSVKVLELLQREWREFEKEKKLNNYTDNPELFNDRVAYAMAWSWIGDHRREFFFSYLYRIRQLWSPLPHKLTAVESGGRRLLRYATCAWYCGVYVLAAIGIWRLSRRSAALIHGTPQRALIPATASRGPTALRCRLLQPPWIWGVLLCLAFTAVHTFYWTNLRMRAPLMPFIAMVAAAAIRKSKVQSPKSKVIDAQRT
jgi:hypothetical protein